MKLTLRGKQDEAKGTVSFTFEPEKPVSYLPGQFFYITLEKMNYPDPRGTTRHFTISSSPTEGNNLVITTRIRQESGFKKTLAELPIGTNVIGEGPNGVFVLNDQEVGPLVFVAGGIGITPYRSMIKYVIDKNLNIPMYLIYSNSNDDEVAFKAELEAWTKKYDFFEMSSIITSKDGRIDDLKINKLIGDWRLEIGNSVWWVSGPPAMVDAILDILPKIGIPDAHIRSEKFTGY